MSLSVLCLCMCRIGNRSPHVKESRTVLDWIPSRGFYIPDNLDSGFKLLVELRTAWAVFRIAKPSPNDRGVARGGGVLGCPWPPLGRPSFEQTTYILAVKAIVEKPTFKICFFVKYFRQRLLSLVNMGLHAAIIRLSPLIHEGEQRYKPYT